MAVIELDSDERYIAQCYLYRDLDERNKCELSDRKLLINLRGKSTLFPLGGIQSLSINKRKLLIPIIFSGVFTPFVITGYFAGLFHPVIAILLIISGVFIFIAGWIGQYTLTVSMPAGHQDFPLTETDQHLNAFIDYTNRYIRDEPEEKKSIYMVLPFELHDRDSDFIASWLNRKLGKKECFTYFALIKEGRSMPDRNMTVIMMNPFKVGSEIRYEKSSSSANLRPVVKGKINPDSINRVFTVDDFLIRAQNNY